MHHLKTIFDKIIPIVKQTLSDQLDSFGNLHAYPNKPDLPHLTNYNRRSKYLAGFTEQLASMWAQILCLDKDTYSVDSIPISIAHIAREHSTTACVGSRLHSAPDKGYCASLDDYYIG